MTWYIVAYALGVVTVLGWNTVLKPALTLGVKSIQSLIKKGDKSE